MTRESELSLIRELGPSGLADLKRSTRRRLADIDAGRIRDIWAPPPCTIKILMVIDGSVTFNHSYFGLSELLDTLRTNPEYWVDFDVTRAHRQLDPHAPTAGTPADTLYGPHYQGFRLTQPGFNLDEFQQVWFVGWNSGSNDNLTEDELELLYRWMNNGGGVFAVGDHFTLGEAMCSDIPRVGSMRAWNSADTPPGSGDNRHDTLVPGRDYAATSNDESVQYTFDDESDDIPMKLRLRRYYGWDWLSPRWPRGNFGRIRTWSPHPIMCGKDGPIDVFPDHPHEGEVVQPSDLGQSPSFNGYQHREYPNFGGSPLAPEIIAWAKVRDDHTDLSDLNKGFANAKEFGAAGAFDGHRVDVGRVVVDSTWHHWMDVNLTGRMHTFTSTPGNIETGDNRKLEGFTNTAQGQATLERIKNYFRNVAIWLSPPDELECMNNRALWGCIWRYPLIEQLHPALPLYLLGKTARDALGRRAGHCQVRSFWYLPLKKLGVFDKIDPRILIDAPVPQLDEPELGDLILGGIVREMLVAGPKVLESGKEPSDKLLDGLVARGTAAGLEEMTGNLTKQMKAAEHINEALRRTTDKRSNKQKQLTKGKTKSKSKNK